MAQGILELKESRNGQIEPSTELSMQYFLDRLYMSRISIRMLINQHSKCNTKVYLCICSNLIVLCFFYLHILAILFGEIPQSGRHVGCIDPLCDPHMVVQDAYENARFLCDQYYLASPELEVIEHNGKHHRALSLFE